MTTEHHPRGGVWWRRRVAPAAGLAFLMAGGAIAVRVTAVVMLSESEGWLWLYTAAALVLAGVALVLIALPAIVGDDATRVDETRAPRATLTAVSRPAGSHRADGDVHHMTPTAAIPRG